ncbi:hypothetical protein HW555_012247, partial [Spodoptera exigua]
MSDDEDDLVKKLREQITHLTLELQSAHSEIESLSLENSNLKSLNEKLSKNNDLYKKIRQVLQEITNTNIIICTPTYKFFTNSYLYNSRVETFNNLLYLDTITHEHAYFLDSNENLAYDDTMFNRRTGAINGFGMKILFKDIYRMIDYIESSISSCNIGDVTGKEMSPNQNNIIKPTPQKLF